MTALDMRARVAAEPPEPPEPETPQVFVRVLVTPAGLPWAQERVAALDARHGAPLPIADLMHRVRRLAPWAPGRPGRFAAFYVRAQEYRAPFERIVDVEGTALKVAFGRPAGQVRLARDVIFTLALLGVTGALLGGGVALALQARATAVARLSTVSALAQSRQRQVAEYARGIAQANALHAAVGRAAPVGAVMADLAWVADAKAPDTRLAAVHWDHGLLGVEVRGEAAPFLTPDRTVQRLPRPLRPGVWLWGVRPMSAGVPAAADRP